MGIEWFRDIVICIFGVIGTIVFIFLTVLFYKIYRRTSSILDSLRAASCNIQDISSYIRNEAIKPIVQLVSLIQGVRKGIETVSNFFKKEEGRKDG